MTSLKIFLGWANKNINYILIFKNFNLKSVLVDENSTDASVIQFCGYVDHWAWHVGQFET